MLTPAQELWINSLNDSDSIVIKPLDTTAEDKFRMVKKLIQAELGSDREVLHRGATSLGISGQDEIDVYVPVIPADFFSLMPRLSGIFGPPASLHLTPLDRARFVTFIDGKRIDVFLMNIESKSWIDGVKFEKYLAGHPEALEAYRLLKEDCTGLSTRNYYRRKVAFINEIVARADIEAPPSMNS